jgi:hypothetical protein
MKAMKKILKWSGIGLITIIAGLTIFVLLSWEKKFDAPYPTIEASTDPNIIERGKYLALGPAHCGGCHVPMDKVRAFDEGEQMPFSGGWELSFPGFGTFRGPNITPDKETGIGKFTDAEIARSLRYGVGTDGRSLFPMMPFQGLSDQDLTAIISYLRNQEPVNHLVQPIDYKFMSKALFAFGLFKPEGPKESPPKSVTIEPSIEYGKYIAYNMANCRSCHTQVNMNTGEYIGKDFAGKALFEADDFSEGFAFVSPNLTPSPTTGIISNWTEEQFIARFKSGRVHRGSPMPWGSFSRINEVELQALYRFFQSLEPVENEIEKTVYAPGEALPEF